METGSPRRPHSRLADRANSVSVVAIPAERRMLVIGAGGFLGSAMARAAAAHGWQIARWASRNENQIAWFSRIRSGEFDVIVNTATARYQLPEQLSAAAYFTSNVDLPRLVAEAANAGGTPLIHIGTRWSVGERGEGPNCLYAATKALGDAHVLRRGTYGRMAVVRIRDLMGPSDSRSTIVSALRRAALRKAPLDMTAGAQLIDPIDVRDVAEALTSMAEGYAEGHLYEPMTEIGYAPITIRQFVKQWMGATGLEVEPVWGALPDRGTELMEIQPVHPPHPHFRPRPRHETLSATAGEA